MTRLSDTRWSSELELFTIVETLWFGTHLFQQKPHYKRPGDDEIALLLRRPLNKSYQEVLRSVFMSSSSSPSGANKKKSMKELQEEVANLYNNIRLFEKGIKFFSGESFRVSRPGPQVENLIQSNLISCMQMRPRCTSPSTC